MKKIMEKFIIKPQTTQDPRRHGDAFLWKNSLDGLDVYVMLGHRLSLWCWLQCKDILDKEHSLVFVDQHCDMSYWRCNKEFLNENLNNLDYLSNLGNYNGLVRENEDDRKQDSCIHSGNFMTLATNIELFNHHYLYISGIDDCERYLKKDNLNLSKFNFYEEIEDVRKNLESNIKNCKNKCIVDIDLDFFDKIENGDTKNKTLEHICKIIKKYKKNISCITIAITDLPTYNEWQERQTQLETINNILNLDIPIPILTDEEIKVIESNIR